MIKIWVSFAFKYITLWSIILFSFVLCIPRRRLPCIFCIYKHPLFQIIVNAKTHEFFIYMSSILTVVISGLSMERERVEPYDHMFSSYLDWSRKRSTAPSNGCHYQCILGYFCQNGEQGKIPRSADINPMYSGGFSHTDKSNMYGIVHYIY